MFQVQVPSTNPESPHFSTIFIRFHGKLCPYMYNNDLMYLYKIHISRFVSKLADWKLPEWAHRLTQNKVWYLLLTSFYRMKKKEIWPRNQGKFYLIDCKLKSRKHFITYDKFIIVLKFLETTICNKFEIRQNRKHNIFKTGSKNISSNLGKGWSI